MFKNAKVGDKVFDRMMRQWAVISLIDHSSNYPILVKFDKNEYRTYTQSGLYTISDKEPSLLWDEVPPFIPPKKPLPQLEVDTKVIVWSNNQADRFNRYFSHFDKDGKIYCFKNGYTSWTTTLTITWDNWELADE